MGKIKPKNTSQRLEPILTEPNGAKRSQTELTGTAREASRHLPWVATDKKSSVKHPTWDLRTPSREVLWPTCPHGRSAEATGEFREKTRLAPLSSGNFCPFRGWRGRRRLRGLRRASARERRSISPRDVDDVARARFPRPYRASGRPDARGSSNEKPLPGGVPSANPVPRRPAVGRGIFFSVFLAPTSRSALADAF